MSSEPLSTIDAVPIVRYHIVTKGNQGWLIALMAWRNLTRRRVRALSMIAVLAVGIAALMLISSLSSSIEHTFGENVYDILSSDIIIDPGSGGGGVMFPDAEEIAQDISANVSGVESISLRIEAEGLMSTGIGWKNTTGALVYGIDRTGDRKVSSLTDYIVRGAYSSFESGSSGSDSYSMAPIIVGREFLKHADVGVEDGDGIIENDETIRLTFGRLRESDGDITPVVLDFVIVAAFDSYLPYFDGLTVFIPIEQCRQLLDINQFDPKANRILIRIEDENDAANVAGKIRSGFEKGTIGSQRSDEGAEGPSFPMYRVRTHEEFREHYLTDIIATTRPVGYLVVSVSLASAILRMAHTSAAAVQERIFDIGILRSMGFTRGLILRIYLVESGLSGILGGCFGILLGYGIIILMKASSLSLLSLPLSELNLFPTSGFLLGLLLLASGVGMISVTGLLRRALRDPTVFLMKAQ